MGDGIYGRFLFSYNIFTNFFPDFTLVAHRKTHKGKQFFRKGAKPLTISVKALWLALVAGGVVIRVQNLSAGL